MSLIQTNLAASRGFDSGNYANAYVSTDFDESWWNDEDDEFKGNPLYRAGFVVGFYSSYEDHEVPGDNLDELETARGLLSIEKDDADTKKEE